jgi:hypothetical protein
MKGRKKMIRKLLYFLLILPSISGFIIFTYAMGIIVLFSTPEIEPYIATIQFSAVFLLSALGFIFSLLMFWYFSLEYLFEGR